MKIEYLSVEGIVDIAVGGVITLGDRVMSESSALAISLTRSAASPVRVAGSAAFNGIVDQCGDCIRVLLFQRRFG